MKKHLITAFISVFLLQTLSIFSQNKQFMKSNIFYSNGYFFDADQLIIKKYLPGNPVCFGQNDSFVFTGNGNNIFSWDKSSLEQSRVFDTALFYDVSVTDYGFNWNIVYLNGKKYSLDNKKHIISVYDKDGFYINDITDNENSYERNTNGRDMLVKGNNSIVHVKDLDSETGYIFSCYDDLGNEKWSTGAKHTVIEIKDNTHYHKRFLNYFEHNSKYIIFTTNVFYGEFSKTIILDLSSGRITELPVTICGVLSDKDDNIAGLFGYNDKDNEIIFYNNISEEIFWKYAYNERMVSPSKVTALIHKDKIILALYHQISTGSDLIALDLKNGSLKWHAKVDQVNASHSKYYNRVNLFSFKDKILMEGIESYGKYLQVFDVNSGAKLYSDLNTK